MLSCKLLSLLACQVSPPINPSVKSTHWVRLPELSFLRMHLFLWLNSPPSLLSFLVSLFRAWPVFNLASISLFYKHIPRTFRRQNFGRLLVRLVEMLYFFNFLKVPYILLMEKRSYFCYFGLRILLLISIPTNNLVTLLLSHFFSSLLPYGSLISSLYHSLKILVILRIIFLNILGRDFFVKTDRVFLSLNRLARHFCLQTC